MKLTDYNFETNAFPEHLCTLQNPRETGVRDSDRAFLCILHDPRGSGECRLKVLMPYTAEPLDEDESDLLYGWTDGPNVYDHKEREVHGDVERVVAWAELPEDTTVENFDYLGLI